MNDFLTIVFLLVVIGTLIYLLFRAGWNIGPSKAAKSKIYVRVNELKSLKDTQDPSTLRDMVVQLDSLLSKSLQLRYSNSKSCGENLKQARNLFKRNDYDKIWKYHKLRNQIVHESYTPDQKEAGYAYDTLRQAIYKILS